MTACVLYTSIIIIEIILLGVGILLILEGADVEFTKYLPLNLANLSKT